MYTSLAFDRAGNLVSSMSTNLKESYYIYSIILKQITMSKISAFIGDTRMPGGSAESIKIDYDLDVHMYEDGTFQVEGAKEDVDAYLEDYGIFVDEEDYEEL